MERFYTFFGSSLKKDLDLLRFLYLQKRFVPIEEISATLALDRRSIQKSFIALTKQLEQNAEEKHPILLAKHGAGYKFNGNKTDYKHLLRQLLAKNPFFQLLETLLLHNEINVVQFTNDYFFSESTVRKRVYELENLLAPLGFTLKKSKGNVQLNGDEARIRYFMVAFFWRTFSGVDWPFNHLSQSKCEEIARAFYRNNHIPFNTIELKQTTYILAVICLRFRQGQTIAEEKLQLQPPLKGLDLTLFQQSTNPETPIFTQLSQELMTHFFLNEKECQFCFLWLMSNLERTFPEEQLNCYFPSKKTSDQQLTTIQKALASMTSPAEKMVISQPRKQVILNTILNGILSVELFGETVHTLAGYNTAQFLTEHFPNLQLHSEQLLAYLKVYHEDLEKRKGLALYVATAWTLILPPARFQQVIRIKLETDLPFALSLAIKELIQTPFQGFYNLDLRDHFEDDDYDLCISTSPLTATSAEIPVILINAQITLPDLLAIHQAIEGVLRK